MDSFPEETFSENFEAQPSQETENWSFSIMGFEAKKASLSARSCVLSDCLSFCLFVWESVCLFLFRFLSFSLSLSLSVALRVPLAVYTYFSVHTYIHTCMHACMHACMHVCVHACIHTYIHIQVYVHLHVYVYIYMCIHIFFASFRIIVDSGGDAGSKIPARSCPGNLGSGHHSQIMLLRAGIQRTRFNVPWQNPRAILELGSGSPA